MLGTPPSVREPATIASERDILEPEGILDRLLEFDEGLGVEEYYSERAAFYNPGRAAPLGVIFAAIKDHDGPNDRRSHLDRPGVFRFAFQLTRADYIAHFERVPPRPPKGSAVEVPFDVSRRDVLTPHPVYAWMRWVQILCPTAESFEELRPMLDRSLAAVKERWRKRATSR